MDVRVEQVTPAVAALGEGPVWDGGEAVLWWVDITGQAVHRFDPATSADESREWPMPVGAVVPRSGGGLVLTDPQGFATFDWATGAGDRLADVEADQPRTRMNDGKCDARGRFWAGTMAFDAARGAGSLYCLDVDHTVRKVVDGVTISNGLGWSADGATMFYIDSIEGTVDAFGFDVDTGAVGGRRSVIRIDEEDGLPDGMTTDADGYLWVALFNGGAVRRYSPDGVLDRVVTLPAPQVTSCAFGGPDLGDLYITTAAHGYTEDERAAHPAAGALFRYRPGVTGTAAHFYAG